MTMPVDISPEIEEMLSKLKELKWKVKINWVNGVDGSKDVKRFAKAIARYKHISLRIAKLTASWSHATLHRMNIYKRNANGGYVIAYSDWTYKNYQQVFDKAVELSQEEEPNIPSWESKELPKPFKYGNTNTLRYIIDHYNDKYENRIVNSKLRVSVKFPRTIMSIDVIGAVIINNDCTVSDYNIMDPSADKAWILLKIDMNELTMHIISTVDEYYVIRESVKFQSGQDETRSARKRKSKVMKIDLDAADEEFSHNNTHKIRIAIESYINKLKESLE